LEITFDAFRKETFVPRFLTFKEKLLEEKNMGFLVWARG